MLLEWSTNLRYSISCTTRPPRAGEIDGRDYYFVSEEEFDRRLRAGEFIEHAVVHGHRYGTPIDALERDLRAGYDVLMDIDVQGAAQIREAVRGGRVSEEIRRNFVDIFIAPPSLADLEERLRRRGTDDERTIRERLAHASGELRRWREYTYLVVNDDLSQAAVRLQSIVTAEKCRSDRVRPGEMEGIE